MAESTKPGVTTGPYHHHHRRHKPTGHVAPKPVTAASTPGVKGRVDQGDPSWWSLHGWTPNVTGWRDWGDHTLQYFEGLFSSPKGPGTAARTADGTPTAAGRVHETPGVKGDLKVAQLKKIYTRAGDDYLQQVCDELNANPVKFGLHTVLLRAHFFAQVREEGGPLLAGKVEDLTYSNEALKKFSYYRNRADERAADCAIKDPAHPHRFLQNANEQNIGNKAYGNRMGNGDTASGDGFRYRGRGMIQCTGRNNYQMVTRVYKTLFGGNFDFEANPDLMARFPHNLRSAVCFWIDTKAFEAAAKGDQPENVNAVTRIVNKDTDTYDKRRQHFVQAYAAFK